MVATTFLLLIVCRIGLEASKQHRIQDAGSEKLILDGVLDLEVLLYFDFVCWKLLCKYDGESIVASSYFIRHQRKPEKRYIKGITSG